MMSELPSQFELPMMVHTNKCKVILYVHEIHFTGSILSGLSTRISGILNEEYRLRKVQTRVLKHWININLLRVPLKVLLPVCCEYQTRKKPMSDKQRLRA